MLFLLLPAALAAGRSDAPVDVTAFAEIGRAEEVLFAGSLTTGQPIGWRVDVRLVDVSSATAGLDMEGRSSLTWGDDGRLMHALREARWVGWLEVAASLQLELTVWRVGDEAPLAQATIPSLPVTTRWQDPLEGWLPSRAPAPAAPEGGASVVASLPGAWGGLTPAFTPDPVGGIAEGGATVQVDGFALTEGGAAVPVEGALADREPTDGLAFELTWTGSVTAHALLHWAGELVARYDVLGTGEVFVDIPVEGPGLDASATMPLAPPATPVTHRLPRLDVAEDAAALGPMPVDRDVVRRVVTIANTGRGTLRVVPELDGDPRLWLEAGEFTVPAGEARDVELALLPREPGPLAATLRLTTSDPWAPVVELAVTGTVEAEPERGCTTSPTGGWLALLVGALAVRTRGRS